MIDEVLSVVRGIRVEEAFAEAVDEDAGVGGGDLDGGVVAVAAVEGEEDRAGRLELGELSGDGAVRGGEVGAGGGGGKVGDEGGIRDVVGGREDGVGGKRVHLNATEEVAAGFGDAEEEKDAGDSNSDVDAVLNG